MQPQPSGYAAACVGSVFQLVCQKKPNSIKNLSSLFKMDNYAD